MTEATTYTREQISKMLQENICEVTFTKVNGEVRVMPCTLDSKIVPPAPEPKVHETSTDNPIDFPKVKKVNLDSMSVWCMDKQSWRAFRVANVTDVKVIEK
jgi:hypothetical protein